MSQPTAEELLHHHLPYEFDMLRGTYNRIGKFADEVVGNALIESFCTHARTLFEFFEKTRGARAYADNAYVPFDGGDEHWRESIVRKLNNQVSHLLDGRTAVQDEKIGSTDQAEILGALVNEMTVFRARLLPKYVAPIVQQSAVPVTQIAPQSTNHVQAFQTDVRTVLPWGGNDR